MFISTSASVKNGRSSTTASLAELEGIADVTTTESQRFWPSTHAKPVDAPCSKHMQSQGFCSPTYPSHEHARTLIPHTCGTSPTHIDKWHVAPEKWHHKQIPKETNVTSVNTLRSGRGHNIRSLRRHLIRPFRQHAFRDQDIRNVHDVRSRAACLPQELA